MVMAVAKAIEEGAKAIICASSGNTWASAATYGASAGLAAVVVLPRGRIAAAKLLQAQAAGARVLAVEAVVLAIDPEREIGKCPVRGDDWPARSCNKENSGFSGFNPDGLGWASALATGRSGVPAGALRPSEIKLHESFANHRNLIA